MRLGLLLGLGFGGERGLAGGSVEEVEDCAGDLSWNPGGGGRFLRVIGEGDGEGRERFFGVLRGGILRGLGLGLGLASRVLREAARIGRAFIGSGWLWF